jgi:2-polyprenyl-3-methyl-5-hydroxy-6-metoxy-1,4-benzoquinol methylase
MAETYTYQGNELELFRHANNWKTYFSKVLLPFISGKVLEVGAGIGATTKLLNNGSAREWTMLEPDPHMFESLKKKMSSGEFPVNTRVIQGTLTDVEEKFDTIIYIDVLEHIEHDQQELERSAMLLNEGGILLVLSPAFPSLFNPFDKAIGHYRRYTKKQLKKITPADLKLVKTAYYDSAGYFAAMANKIFLRKKYPTQKEVLLWDRWLVPVSRLTDKLFFHSFGKSIIAVWKK